ncbi:MAG: hypothetical protein BTN85_2116 [Candidatus Methanohalarchaeum thermophilum]|uniref:Uncharacterized protein n=1 Tax=Methanohalarchaeum thermophilum TaxID=1903181 RepID=A0A1Q6DSW4_METT1|nr:MAG: hypothetical protein BTN85_2116 [Candidatus Methanohalarchaeum thermophilum]
MILKTQIKYIKELIKFILFVFILMTLIPLVLGQIEITTTTPILKIPLLAFDWWINVVLVKLKRIIWRYYLT